MNTTLFLSIFLVVCLQFHLASSNTKSLHQRALHGTEEVAADALQSEERGSSTLHHFEHNVNPTSEWLGSSPHSNLEDVKPWQYERFGYDEASIPTTTPTPIRSNSISRKVKDLWLKFHDRILFYASKLRDRLTIWGKPKNVPLFSEAQIFMNRFGELFDHLDAHLTPQQQSDILKKFVTDVKGKPIKDPYRFYTSELKAKLRNIDFDPQTAHEDLEIRLVWLFRQVLEAREKLLKEFKATQSKLNSAKQTFAEFIKSTNGQPDLEKLALKADKYRSHVPVNDLHLEHPYQSLFLYLFGPADIGSPVEVRDVTEELADPHAEGLTIHSHEPVVPKKEVIIDQHILALKGEEWDMTIEQVKAIFMGFANAKPALRDLYEVQEVERAMESQALDLPKRYAILKTSATMTLQGVHKSLLDVFGTEMDITQHLTEIHGLLIQQGRWSDQENSRLEWTLLPLIEPVGAGRSLSTSTHSDWLMNQLGLVPLPKYALEYDEQIKPVISALSQHYKNAERFRALRLSLEREFNIKGQKKIIKMLKSDRLSKHDKAPVLGQEK